jgi:anti-sigma factor RsiW
MSKMDNELLQRYFDGELSAEERARCEAELTEEDQLRLQALEEIRGLVGHALDAQAADVDLWSGIDARLRGGQKQATVRRWRERVRLRATGPLAALAAVAALLLVFKPWHAASENDCDIEHLETNGSVATVFHMADMPHGATTVIWTEED